MLAYAPVTPDSAFHAYLALHAPVVALHPREKRPIGLVWQSAIGVPDRYVPGANVGLALGGRDGWVDVDLDSPESRLLAPAWLPEPVARWGRSNGAGKEDGERAASHYLYRFEKCPVSFLQSPLGVELRSATADGTGLQSVLPPSVIYVDENGNGAKVGVTTERLAVYAWAPNPNGSAAAPPDFVTTPKQGHQEATDLAVAVRMLAIAAITAKLTRDADHQRHDIFLSLCGGLASCGWPEVCIEMLVRSAAVYDKDLPDRLAAAASTVNRIKQGGHVKSWSNLEAYWPEPIVKKVIAAAREVATLEKWDAPQEGAIVVTGKFAADNDEIVRILTDVENMFVRGGQLVTVAAKGNSLAIEACTEGNITEIVTRYGNIQKRNNGKLETHTPDARAIRAILERRTWPGLRELTDVVTMPVIRADGTVISEPGYDIATKTLYRPRTEHTWAFGETQADAISGLQALLEPIEEFPFINNLSRSAWLAFVLTLVGRAAISGCVPGFASDAAQGGSGKSLCVRLASIIATGNDAASQPFPSAMQVEQSLFSAGLAGQRLLFFDNCDRKKAESDALEGAMTSAMLSQRKFHAQYTIEAPFRCVVALSGNNMQFSPTMGRRVLHARQVLRSGIDPTMRKFKIAHVLEWVQERQRDLYAAALTCLIAHAKAGRPKGSAYMGSFEEWSQIIPAALEWCGAPNPIEARASKSAPSPDSEYMYALLSAVAEYQCKREEGNQVIPKNSPTGRPEWTSAMLWEYLDVQSNPLAGEDKKHLRRRLMAAFQSSAQRNRPIDSSKAIGECLSKVVDTEIDGVGVLRSRIGHGKTRYWSFDIREKRSEIM
jgi:hypothetical protein